MKGCEINAMWMCSWENGKLNDSYDRKNHDKMAQLKH